MSQSLDEICPRYYGEDRIDVSLVTTGKLRAFNQITLALSYDRTHPEGIVLPLEMVVQGPSVQSYQHRWYDRTAPTTLLFTPREGGSHLVLLREFAHNKWWGRIVLQIDGPYLEAPRPV